MGNTFQKIEITIRWYWSTETIVLNLGALSCDSNRELITQDRILHKGKWLTLTLRPTPAYTQLENGDHRLTLTYRRENQDVVLGLDYIWGMTTIVLSSNLLAADIAFRADEKRWRNSDVRHYQDYAIRLISGARTIVSEVSVRCGQGAFRAALFKQTQRCEITGDSVREMLDAAHINAVADNSINDPSNGLLLRADFHRLYDAGYFWIDMDGCFHMRPEMPESHGRILKDMERLGDATLARVRDALLERERCRAED